MWTEVYSSVPHFLQVGLLFIPIIYKCFLKVLCPVRRPITILDCVLLKDNNRVLVARSGPEINSRAVSGPRHNSDTQRQGGQYVPPAIALESYTTHTVN